MDIYLSWAQTIIGVIALFAIIVGVRQLRETKNAQYLNIIQQAEGDFNELNKLMLTDQALRDIYRLEDPTLEKVDDTYLRRFVFLEMYYAHLSRVYVLMKSPINPYSKSGFSNEYWGLYENMLKYLLLDNIFIQVHESAKKMKTFEESFIKEVDRIQEQVKTSYGSMQS